MDDYKFAYKQRLILLIGNIGNGKSTYLRNHKELCEKYVVVSRDCMRYMLGNGEYVFNTNFEPAVWSAEESLFCGLLATHVNIIVDEVNMNLGMRSRYIGPAIESGYHVTGIVFPQLSMEESVKRRLGSNHGYFKYDVWCEVWSRFNMNYTQPSFHEGFDRIITINPKDGTEKITEKPLGVSY